MTQTSHTVRSVLSLLSLTAVTLLSSCNSKSDTPAASAQPQTQTTCPATYAPIPVTLAAPAKAVSFDDVLGMGELTFGGAQVYAEFLFPDVPPHRIHEAGGADGKLALVCENQDPNGFLVSGLDVDLPANISRTGSPDDGSAQYTTDVRKFSIFTTNGTLEARSEEDATVGRSLDPNFLLGLNPLVSEYHLYQVSPTQYELRVEEKYQLQTTRLVVTYDFHAK